MRFTRPRCFEMIAVLALLSACAFAFAFQTPNNIGTSQETQRGTVIINITCGPDEILRVLSAFHVAEDAVASGRKVVLFFNGRGITVPVRRVSDELQLGRERRMWVILQELIGKGVEIVVARQSMRILNMHESDFLIETKFGDWGGSIFCDVNANTVVFSY